MLKFTIIESQQQIFKNQSIDVLTEKMKFLQGGQHALKNQQNVTFIITEGIKKEIIGGVCVLKSELKNIQEDIKELVATLAHSSGYVWECSSVYIETSAKYPLLGTSEARDFSQDFYRGLYEGLVEFGKKKGAGFVIMKLAAEAYASTKEFGLWPYVVELKPENSPDGLFHGILPLTGSQYEAYQKVWESVDKFLPASAKSYP